MTAYARVACSWCGHPCQLSQHDEDGDPCADLAGLEYATAAAARHFVSAAALRQAAIACGLVGSRQLPCYVGRGRSQPAAHEARDELNYRPAPHAPTGAGRERGPD